MLILYLKKKTQHNLPNYTTFVQVCLFVIFNVTDREMENAYEYVYYDECFAIQIQQGVPVATRSEK